MVKKMRNIEEYNETEKWLSGIKDTTAKSYKSVMRRFVSFSGLDPRQLIDEAEEDFSRPRRERGKVQKRLKDFYTYLVKEYVPKRRRNGKDKRVGISPYRASTMIGSLRSFYEKNGFPLGKINLPKAAPKKENARIEFSPRDIKAMIEVAPTKRDKALILFGYQGGMDVDTVVRLELGDFQDKDVEKLLNNKVPDTPVLLHIVRGKAGIDFHTCLGYDAMDAFRAYIHERKLRGEELTLSSPAFVKEGSKKYSWQRIDKALVHNLMRNVAVTAGVVSKERLERADFNIAGFHALRGTFSRRLEFAGMPPAYIDYMQGHSLPHNGAYRKPHPRKLLAKYKEFEHALSISDLPASAKGIDEKLKTLEARIEKDSELIDALYKEIDRLRDEQAMLEEKYKTRLLESLKTWFEDSGENPPAWLGSLPQKSEVEQRLEDMAREIEALKAKLGDN